MKGGSVYVTAAAQGACTNLTKHDGLYGESYVKNLHLRNKLSLHCLERVRDARHVLYQRIVNMSRLNIGPCLYLIRPIVARLSKIFSHHAWFGQGETYSERQYYYRRYID